MAESPGDGLLCDDPNLKEAAKQIASCVEMPYEDLKDFISNPPVRKPDLQCCLWEIYKCS